MNALREIGDGLWTVTGKPIQFLSFPYELRCSIVQLGSSLWVHSPVQLDVARALVDGLGAVEHIVSPNKLHHLYLGDWANAYRSARLYAPPGLRRKRPDLRFDKELENHAEPAWEGELEQRVVRGSFFMDEVVFFHRASSSLILGDLIENHDPAKLRGLRLRLAAANRMLAPSGSTPRNYRLTFYDRRAARDTVEEMLSWQPKRVIMAHGPIVEDRATEFLHQAFAWLF